MECLKSINIPAFQRHILAWYRAHKRDDLPWRYTKNRPVGTYEILVSEIMLQQTQISRVLDKFPKFLHAFPTIRDLASAPLDTVLREWQGMGYNRRALYLQQCAQQIMKKWHGVIPADIALLKTLPGIGPYTAGAVSCFAFNQPTVFLDTNIRKFFIHHFFMNTKNNAKSFFVIPSDCGIQTCPCANRDLYKRGSGFPIVKACPRPDRGSGMTGKWPDDMINKKISDAEILPIAEKLLYKKNPRIWNYALMDYGSLVLSGKPELLSAAKSYHKQSPFLGSNRFFRSQIVQYILKHKQASLDELQWTSLCDISPILVSLQKEGLIQEIRPAIFEIKRKV